MLLLQRRSCVSHYTSQLLFHQEELMVRALNRNLNLRVGLTHTLPVSFTANDAINAPFRSQSIPMAQRGSPDSQMMVAVQSDHIPPTSAHGHLEQSATPASSFSSIVSLQALTNWWTPRSGTTAMTSCMIPENLGPSSNFVAELPPMKPKGPVQRKYVSKDKQLMKLRIRLERERRADCDRFQMNMCRTCVAGEVCL